MSRILVADDTPSILALYRKLLQAEGYDVVTAADGAEALEAVRNTHLDVVVLDVGMPQLDGFEVCRRLKSDPATRLMTVVLITGLSELTDRVRGLEAGADDFLSKPVHPLELRARINSLARLKTLIDELDSAEAAFLALALTIEARDPYTKGHCERLASYAVRLGRALDLSDEDLAALHRGGYLHDVGKVGVSDSLLLKPGKLTPEEFAQMRLHPEIGERLCAPLHSLRHVRPIIRSHHERLDGSGYPDALRGDQVPLLAQIVGMVDVYDALTSRRPYRDALPADVALRHLAEEVSIGRFSAGHFEAFAGVVGQKTAVVTRTS